ncbi:hypothetical protein B0H11DRAFT_1912206 [Mycena galericulata]|nr:hypothetical protein B0H11DRAFT_1912206 [Mycena galericulata]
MPARAKPPTPLVPSLREERKAAKRREAGRRYYARMLGFFAPIFHARQSQKLYKRQWDPPKTKKKDKSTGDEDEGEEEPTQQESVQDHALEAEEAVAHEALRAMSRKGQSLEFDATVDRKVMTLSAIDAAGESSQSEDSEAPSVGDEEVAVRASLKRQIRNLAAHQSSDSSSAAPSSPSVCEGSYGSSAASGWYDSRVRRHRENARRKKIGGGKCAGLSTLGKLFLFFSQTRPHANIDGRPSTEDLYLVRGTLGVRAWLRDLDNEQE